MLNDFGPYASSLDPSVIDSDQSRQSVASDHCNVETSNTGLHPSNISRSNIAVPPASWNYNPYIGNFYNYYPNQPYEFGDVSHQYTGQKSNSQYTRNYGQPLPSTSVLQCCDPRCQLLSKHHKYPYNPAYCNKLPPQRPRHPPKNYVGGVYEMPKSDLVKPNVPIVAAPSIGSKFTSCVPYTTNQNDLSSKYSQQPNYNPQYQSVSNSSKPLFIPEGSSHADYYLESSKSAFWNTKQNLWNRNPSNLYYTSSNTDKNINQKLSIPSQKISTPHFDHNGFGINNQHGHGILFNHLLDSGGRPYNSNSYFTSYHPNLNSFNNNPQPTYNHEPHLYTENVRDDACIGAQSKVIQPTSAPYSVRYVSETALPPNDCYQEVSTKQAADSYRENIKNVSGKPPSLDVREFLSTWDEGEDDKPSDGTVNETPVIVLDYTSEENSLPRELEKFSSSNDNNDNNEKSNEFPDNINFQTHAKFIHNDKSDTTQSSSPHTSVIQSSHADILINSASNSNQSLITKSTLKFTQPNTDINVPWYNDLKKRVSFSYDVDSVNCIPRSTITQHPSSLDEDYQLQTKRISEKSYAEEEYLKNIDRSEDNSYTTHNQYTSQFMYNSHKERLNDSTQPERIYTTIEQEFSYIERETSNLEKNSYITKSIEEPNNPNYPKHHTTIESKIQDYSLEHNHNSHNILKDLENPNSVSSHYLHLDNVNQNLSLEDVSLLKEQSLNNSTSKIPTSNSNNTLISNELESSKDNFDNTCIKHSEQEVNSQSIVNNGSQLNDSMGNSMPEICDLNYNINSPYLKDNSNPDVEIESTYNGVIQKAGTFIKNLPNTNDNECESNILSMPLLLPSPKSSNNILEEDQRQFHSSNLTLNDVYENNVIFDTKSLKNTNKSKEYEDDTAVPSSEPYQPLDLALNKCTIENDNSSPSAEKCSNIQISDIPVCNESSNIKKKNLLCDLLDNGHRFSENYTEKLPNLKGSNECHNLNILDKVDLFPVENDEDLEKKMQENNESINQKSKLELGSSKFQEASHNNAIFDIHNNSLINSNINDDFKLYENNNQDLKSPLNLELPNTSPTQGDSFKNDGAVVVKKFESKNNEISSHSSTNLEEKKNYSQRCQALENINQINKDSTIWYTKAQLKEMSYAKNNSPLNQITSSDTINLLEAVDINISKKDIHSIIESNNKIQPPDLNNDTIQNNNIYTKLNSHEIFHNLEIQTSTSLEDEKVINYKSSNINYQQISNIDQDYISNENLSNDYITLSSKSLDVNENCISNSSTKSNMSKQIGYANSCEITTTNLALDIDSKSDKITKKLSQENTLSPILHSTILDSKYQTTSKISEKTVSYIDDNSKSYLYKRKLNWKETDLPMKKRRQEFNELILDLYSDNNNQAYKNQNVPVVQKDVILKPLKSYTINSNYSTLHKRKYKQKSKNKKQKNKLKERFFKNRIRESWKSAHGKKLKQVASKKKHQPKKYKKKSLSLKYINFQSKFKSSQLLDTCNLRISHQSPKMIEPIINNNNNNNNELISKEPMFDDFLNIPSIAPTPQCDLSKDDSIDSDIDLQDKEFSLECEDDKISVVSTSNSIVNAPTPNCDLSEDEDLSNNVISNILTGDNSYNQTKNDKFFCKAPSPCCILDDVNIIPKEDKKAPVIDFYSQKEDISPLSSVAPSPHCDIINGVLLDDTDLSRDSEGNYHVSTIDSFDSDESIVVSNILSLKELALMALQSIENSESSSSSLKFVDVRATGNETEIIIYSNAPNVANDNEDTVLTTPNSPLDNESMLDCLLNNKEDNDDDDKNFQELKCQCCIVESGDSAICLKCSLYPSSKLDENESTVSFLMNEPDENENNLHSYESIQARFSNTCIEDTNIDQKLSVSPHNDYEVTNSVLDDDVSICSEKIVFPDTSSFEYTKKVPITVKVPWCKIFKLDNVDNSNGASDILELGPAQIEIRFSRKRLGSLSIQNIPSDVYSPVLKVKRLILQPAINNEVTRSECSSCLVDANTNCIVINDRFSGEDEILRETGVVDIGNTETNINSRTLSEFKDEHYDKRGDLEIRVSEMAENLNEDADNYLGVPRMVIRKTSCQGYRSYLQTNSEKLQPVVRLYRSKSLDELALKFAQNEDSCHSVLSEPDRRTFSYEFTSTQENEPILKGGLENEVTVGEIDVLEEIKDARLTPIPDTDTENTFDSEITLLPKTEQHHCLLCHRSYPSKELYHLHLKSKFHRHLELTQRKTIHAMYRHFTGQMCPRLRPLSATERKKMKWKPRNANVNHFYHQKTPLQIALHKIVNWDPR